MLTLIIIVIFSFLMVWAAYSDLSRYILSNKLCLSVTLLYPVYLISLYMNDHGLPIENILTTLALAVVLFIVCAGFFALNIMGGGDVKLIPAVALWAGTAHILPYLFITSVIGGLFAALILAKNRLNNSKSYKSSANINLSVAEIKESVVPYGVGIAMGGLYVAYNLIVTFNQKAT